MIRGGWRTVGHSFVRPGYRAENVDCGKGYRSIGCAINSRLSECDREWPIPSENVIGLRGLRDPFGFGLDSVYELERQKIKSRGSRSPQHLASGSQDQVLGFLEDFVLLQAPALL